MIADDTNEYENKRDQLLSRDETARTKHGQLRCCCCPDGSSAWSSMTVSIIWVLAKNRISDDKHGYTDR